MRIEHGSNYTLELSLWHQHLQPGLLHLLQLADSADRWKRAQVWQVGAGSRAAERTMLICADNSCAGLGSGLSNSGKILRGHKYYELQLRFCNGWHQST